MVRSHLTPVKPFFTMAYKDDLKNGRWQKVRLQVWNLLINKINPNLYRNILNCDKLELINESEIIIYYFNNLQKISIEKYLLEIITHFRLVFSNHNITITLKPTTLL